MQTTYPPGCLRISEIHVDPDRAGDMGAWASAAGWLVVVPLLGALATEGGLYPNAWNKFVPRPIHLPRHPESWNELTWPLEYPLAMNELSFLLPHLVKRSQKRLEVYFSRVYNPVWTNPDGMVWTEVLRDEEMIGVIVWLEPVVG